MSRPAARALLALLLAPACVRAGDFHDWAPTPPMGWNSWDCFATTANEARTEATADVMARELAAHGWQYVVVDIQWYEPGSTGFAYNEKAKLAMDGYGRLVPAENKFPGSAGGRGFQALATYVHARGLKFGIHLLRGIPRQAVERNLPILGTSYHAADIADRVRVCEWNQDMYGVDMSRPGAQAYYDSVFALIASWGVDFVKVDDLSRPYIPNEPEVEAIRAAIDRSGRPMVLSLSPGETDLKAGDHAAAHANMWRISDDFWDHWSLLEAQFERLNQWSRFRRPGAWPDADMIPIGMIDLGRPTWFSHDEQVTLMTLWSIARSPLILGADLTRLDEPTRALLTNDEVLAVDQASADNRQLFRSANGGIGWIAKAPGGRDRYLALFNTRDPWVLSEEKRLWRSEPVSAATPGMSVAFKVAVNGLRTVVLVADDSDHPRFWWPAVFKDVRWVLRDGRTLPAGRDYGSHGERRNSLEIPEGAAALEGSAVLDEVAQKVRRDTMVFKAYGFTAADVAARGQGVRVSVADLGLGSEVSIRDLWDHKDVGRVSGDFAPEVPWHGARLYRVSP